MKKNAVPILLMMALLLSLRGGSTPRLNSLPNAQATIYLDFDGYNVNSAYWNDGTPFVCEAAGMTDEQVAEVFNRVAEDFRPFQVNVTTEENKYLAAPLDARIRVVITPTSGWMTGVSGIAYVGSFTWGDDTPAFVFSDRLGPTSPKLVAECCSHESGHSVGLAHQSRYDGTCNLTATYNDGEGTGEASWAPIMGNSYYRNMSGWNNGPTPYGCASTQDNLSIITTQNGFGYREDDYGGDVNASAAAFRLDGSTMTGIITTSADRDAFSLHAAKRSLVHIAVNPFSIDRNFEGANLDIKLELYNSMHQLVRTYDPSEAMNVSIDTALEKGDYYLVVDGTGNINVDDYGSLGSYSITGTATSIAAKPSVVLTGSDSLNTHRLYWQTSCDDQVQLITIEASTDGRHFKPLNSLPASCNKFIYTPFQISDLFYRVRAVSVNDEIGYSDTILLKKIIDNRFRFRVSTLVQDEVVVNAGSDYRFFVMSTGGTCIRQGSGRAGMNRVNMSAVPQGMYLLRILAAGTEQTEKIIKTVR